jgi:hypothetical protein
LRDCEEIFLKTDPNDPDSDGDRIPDGVEFRAGLDPLNRDDVYDDPDRDDERSGDEIKAHTNPQVATSTSHPATRYLHDVAPVSKPDGRSCFTLDVRHITLLTTGKGTQARLGVNRIMFYFDEAPVDRALDHGQIRIACVDVRYVDGALKSPAGGLVSLAESDFIAAKRFDPSQHCKDLTSIPMVFDAGTDARRDGGQ